MLIKKRYLVILSVAVISILLGSLFYINTTFAPKGQEPTIHKDSVNINLLRLGSSGWDGQGVNFRGVVQKIPFAFNPKETFQNATDFWFSLLYWTGAVTVTIEISLNDMYLATKSLSVSSELAYGSFQATDTSLYYSLTSGLNVLTVTSNEPLHLQEFTVFIEYEYQA